MSNKDKDLTIKTELIIIVAVIIGMAVIFGPMIKRVFYSPLDGAASSVLKQSELYLRHDTEYDRKQLLDYFKNCSSFTIGKATCNNRLTEGPYKNSYSNVQEELTKLATERGDSELLSAMRSVQQVN